MTALVMKRWALDSVVCVLSQWMVLQVSDKVKPKIALGSLWRENKKNATKMEVFASVCDRVRC